MVELRTLREALTEIKMARLADSERAAYHRGLSEAAARVIRLRDEWQGWAKRLPEGDPAQIQWLICAAAARVLALELACADDKSDKRRQHERK